MGSLKPDLVPGTIVVPKDFVALFSPPTTIFDDNQSHIVAGIHSTWRENILRALRSEGVQPPVVSSLLFDGGVYIQTQGPRFETASESLFLSQLGDVVGMTAATEAALASELRIPYAMVCSVDNYANGIASQALDANEFQSNVVQHQQQVEAVVNRLMDTLVGKRPSSCP